MKNQVKDPLDNLFASLNDTVHERPSAAFIQDLEARLDALEKKRRKPLFFWWFFSALGAVLFSGSYFLFFSNHAANQRQQHAENKNITSARAMTKKQMDTTSTSSLSLSSSSSSSSSSTFLSSSTNLIAAHPTTSSTLLSSSVSSSNAAPSPDKTRVQEETYIINPILLSDDHEKDCVLIVDQPTPVLPKAVAPTKKRIQHQIGLQFGVSGIFSSFDLPASHPLLTDDQLKLFRETRELGERNTSSWDFNLRYGMTFNNWQLQTGLHYFEWGEQLQYDVISVEGTNRYRYLSVPLLLGYSFDFGKIQIVPFTGLAYGKCLTANGNYIEPQVNGVTLVTAKNFAGTFIGQLELQYVLNSKLVFTCTPVYRRALGPLIDQQLIVNSYQSLGLQTGFLYRF
jgi:hypothetical protein